MDKCQLNGLKINEKQILSNQGNVEGQKTIPETYFLFNCVIPLIMPMIPQTVPEISMLALASILSTSKYTSQQLFRRLQPRKSCFSVAYNRGKALCTCLGLRDAAFTLSLLIKREFHFFERIFLPPGGLNLRTFW